MSQQFESPIKQIPYSQQRVYDRLSDLSNLEQYTDMLERLPQDKIQIQDLVCDTDSVSFTASPAGRIEVHIVDREEPKCIKFEATSSPIPITFWIQLLPTSADSCKMKLTLRTELNIFLKGMLQKPLKEGLDKIADVLANIPY